MLHGEPVPVTVLGFLPWKVPFAVVNGDPEGWTVASLVGPFVLNLPCATSSYFVVH